MPKQQTKAKNIANTAVTANQVNPPANPFQIETPTEVLEYIKLREMKEITEARIEELAPLVIKWGEEQIRQKGLTSKRLPIPELTQQGLELLITERKTVDKVNPELAKLADKIAKEKEIAETINQLQIKITLSKIDNLRTKLEHLSNTETGREFQQQYDELEKSLTYLKKGLTLRNSR